MEEVQLPDFVRKRIELLASKYNYDVQTLTEMYMRIYNDPWVQSDPQFRNDYERHAYAVRVLTVKVAARPPTTEVVVIPFGVSEPRVSRSSGVPVSRIYVLAKTGEKTYEKRVIVAKERLAELVYEVQLFSVYKVRVFNAGQVMFAVDETRFGTPQQTLTMDPLVFLEKYIGVKRFKLIDVHKNLSRRQGNFVDEFDLRGISGIVVDYRKGQRRDGLPYAFYVVSDESVVEDIISEEGKVIPARFTVWIPSFMLKYAVDSEVFFYGTVQVSNDGIPFMNAIGAVPIRARPIEA